MKDLKERLKTIWKWTCERSEVLIVIATLIIFAILITIAGVVDSGNSSNTSIAEPPITIAATEAGTAGLLVDIVEITEPEMTDELTEPETEAVVEDTEPATVPTEPETESETESTEPSSEPSDEIVLGKPGTASTWSDRELLACVIFQEAGSDSQCDECRRRVADVVLNRVSDDRYPDTIYEVLVQYRQYGNFYWTDVKWADRAYYESNRHAVERAFRIADEVLNGHHSELYGQGYIGQAEFISGRDWIYCCGIYYGR